MSQENVEISGAAVDQRLWYAIELEGGLERRIRVFGDRAEALEAVGLSEQDAHADS